MVIEGGLLNSCLASLEPMTRAGGCSASGQVIMKRHSISIPLGGIVPQPGPVLTSIWFVITLFRLTHGKVPTSANSTRKSLNKGKTRGNESVVGRNVLMEILLSTGLASSLGERE